MKTLLGWLTLVSLIVIAVLGINLWNNAGYLADNPQPTVLLRPMVQALIVFTALALICLYLHTRMRWAGHPIEVANLETNCWYTVVTARIWPDGEIDALVFTRDEGDEVHRFYLRIEKKSTWFAYVGHDNSSVTSRIEGDMFKEGSSFLLDQYGDRPKLMFAKPRREETARDAAEV